MFSEKEIEAYKSIKAPEGLLDKINGNANTKRYTFIKQATKVAGLAACLGIVCCGFLFTRPDSPNIKVNGLEVESSVMFYDVSPAMDMRTSPVFSVPVEIEVDEKVSISVSEGILTVNDTSDEIVEITDSATVWWNVQKVEEMPECEMRIEGKKDVTIITLEFNQAENTITAKKFIE